MREPFTRFLLVCWTVCLLLITGYAVMLELDKPGQLPPELAHCKVIRVFPGTPSAFWHVQCPAVKEQHQPPRVLL